MNLRRRTLVAGCTLATAIVAGVLGGTTAASPGATGGTVVFGAEQEPPCLNGVLAGCNNTWTSWTVGNLVPRSLQDPSEQRPRSRTARRRGEVHEEPVHRHLQAEEECELERRQAGHGSGHHLHAADDREPEKRCRAALGLHGRSPREGDRLQDGEADLQEAVRGLEASLLRAVRRSPEARPPGQGLQRDLEHERQQPDHGQADRERPLHPRELHEGPVDDDGPQPALLRGAAEDRQARLPVHHQHRLRDPGDQGRRGGCDLSAAAAPARRPPADEQGSRSSRAPVRRTSTSTSTPARRASRWQELLGSGRRSHTRSTALHSRSSCSGR